jgi:hypothetical protein
MAGQQRWFRLEKYHPRTHHFFIIFSDDVVTPGRFIVFELELSACVRPVEGAATEVSPFWLRMSGRRSSKVLRKKGSLAA